MCIDLEFYDKNDLLELKKWLDDKKLNYDYFDEENDDYYYGIETRIDKFLVLVL